ncbi:hypothetical protein [Pseudoalteromonas luteoviolacea]|uniref:Uncharacterized protein n=1 Tax=Pseudoalteromonas luteoviolacea S4054 TaxID=1129367 RepID=A0A0F6A6C8_9GAMM|nr:hypothetical protein [Pseudoalteromonas luteoviolacea]AOT07638.1 hypothetical protein S4054249_07190 [Pseudoalteromonas luteoviolacea]AOT12554.1 hypothetical protein S40542_07190 [Pseudoalteromonas luteoviolacea]AOT17468.1 hypothetical protein S4054_07190 [Pseudoalteromonas luteoviolacea]KKE81381.1 hypothetical protein N479_22875 [Pseudoalteromonas luteoviolacea S4054]KZN70610.1 hypothetical protein N481_20555 [Pseudoalteromonas luteoviolacea S4047-1]
MYSKIKAIFITAVAATTLFASLASTASAREVSYSTHYTYVTKSQATAKFRNEFKAMYPGIYIIYTNCYYPIGAGMPVYICEGKGRI